MNKKLILKIFKPNIIEILIVAILLVFIFKSCQPPPKRQIISTQSFELAWESDVISPLVIVDSGKYNDSQVFMDLKTDRVILPITNRWGNSNLTSFNLETGEIDWKTPLTQPNFSIGSNSKEIVVVLSDVPPRQDLCDKSLDYCEAAQVIAYDIDSGEQIWSFLRENMWRAGALTVDDDVASIIGSATRSSHREKLSLNANTGEIIEFQGVEHILDDVSNREKYGDFVFYISENNNKLLAMDKESKNIVGFVQFDGAPISNNQGLGIVTKDDFVVVYLGDSQQLFVFRFEPGI